MFFFFKQKTAVEMRIRDWSSDVCSSDLFSQRSAVYRCWTQRSGVMKTEPVFVHCAIRPRTPRRPRLYRQVAGWKTRAMAPQECAVPTVNGKARSEERRGGKEGVSTCRSRGLT